MPIVANSSVICYSQVVKTPNICIICATMASLIEQVTASADVPADSGRPRTLCVEGIHVEPHETTVRIFANLGIREATRAGLPETSDPNETSEVLRQKRAAELGLTQTASWSEILDASSARALLLNDDDSIVEGVRRYGWIETFESFMSWIAEQAEIAQAAGNTATANRLLGIWDRVHTIEPGLRPTLRNRPKH